MKQVDMDGTFALSNVVLIKYNSVAGGIRIGSNPFNNTIDIHFDKIQSGNINIRLLDLAGREIYQLTSTGAGLSGLRVNLAGKNISAGMYLLQVKTKSQQFVERVIKR